MKRTLRLALDKIRLRSHAQGTEVRGTVAVEASVRGAGRRATGRAGEPRRRWSNPLLWRSLRWGPLQHAAYLGIIAVELLVGLLAGIAVFRMLAARDDPEKFSRAKAVAVMALALGVLLWLAGFEVVGGEYFLMWQSPSWNGQESAFRFAVLCVLGLLFLAQHE